MVYYLLHKLLRVTFYYFQLSRWYNDAFGMVLLEAMNMDAGQGCHKDRVINNMSSAKVESLPT